MCFALPLFLGSVIWSIADHPAAKISAIFFGAVSFVALKTCYYYFSLLSVEKESREAQAK
jgi:hypothetical protein